MLAKGLATGMNFFFQKGPSDSTKDVIGPIGMELAQEALHLVQLKQHGRKRISVHAQSNLLFDSTREALVASPKAVRDLIRKALKSAPFSGREIVTVLPADDVKIMPLAYPHKPNGNEQAMLDLLADRIEGDLSDFVIDYLPIRSHPGDEEHLALVAVAKRKNVTNYLKLIEQAGVKVAALDIGPSAIKRLVTALPCAVAHETVLVINTGQEKSFLTMVSGRRLLLDQQVGFGEKKLLQNLSKVLDIEQSLARELLLNSGFGVQSRDDPKKTVLGGDDVSETLLEISKPLFLKLIDEINRVLVFAASETRGHPVSRIYLLGAITRWKGSDKLLDSMLDIPVVPISHDLGINGNAACNEKDQAQIEILPNMELATGLALRGLNLGT